MKDKVALFYNPVAGGGNFRFKLDDVIHYLQSSGLQVIPYRTNNNQDIKKQMENLNPQDYHTIVAAGGDGTIHGVVNAMMYHDISVPLGVFPVGTSNDLARQMKIANKIKDYCRVITDGKLTCIDLGNVNGEYFINVAAAGYLTDTAHEVNYNLKNKLGKAAYYLKVVEKLPQMRPLQLRLRVDDHTYEMEILLFICLNGNTAAGFKEILPTGSISDGKLDFMAFKPLPPLGGLERLLLNYSRGQLIKDENVFYCQGTKFSLELTPAVTTDLDGEKGPKLPWEITVYPSALQLRIPG
ncbi:MAG: diacylglycerol/lipid kinase family protein [Syntrophomonadaceae bacterium]